jgi:hypothetical protein
MIKKLFYLLKRTDTDVWLPHEVVTTIYSLPIPAAKPLKAMAVDFYIWHVDRTYFAKSGFGILLEGVIEFAKDCLIAIGVKTWSRQRLR